MSSFHLHLIGFVVVGERFKQSFPKSERRIQFYGYIHDYWNSQSNKNIADLTRTIRKEVAFIHIQMNMMPYARMQRFSEENHSFHAE